MTPAVTNPVGAVSAMNAAVHNDPRVAAAIQVQRDLAAAGPAHDPEHDLPEQLEDFYDLLKPFGYVKADIADLFSECNYNQHILSDRVNELVERCLTEGAPQHQWHSTKSAKKQQPRNKEHNNRRPLTNSRRGGPNNSLSADRAGGARGNSAQNQKYRGPNTRSQQPHAQPPVTKVDNPKGHTNRPPPQEGGWTNSEVNAPTAVTEEQTNVSPPSDTALPATTENAEYHNKVVDAPMKWSHKVGQPTNPPPQSRPAVTMENAPGLTKELEKPVLQPSATSTCDDKPTWASRIKSAGMAAKSQNNARPNAQPRPEQELSTFNDPILPETMETSPTESTAEPSAAIQGAISAPMQEPEQPEPLPDPKHTAVAAETSLSTVPPRNAASEEDSTSAKQINQQPPVNESASSVVVEAEAPVPVSNQQKAPEAAQSSTYDMQSNPATKPRPQPAAVMTPAQPPLPPNVYQKPPVQSTQPAVGSYDRPFRGPHESSGQRMAQNNAGAYQVLYPQQNQDPIVDHQQLPPHALRAQQGAHYRDQMVLPRVPPPSAEPSQLASMMHYRPYEATMTRKDSGEMETPWGVPVGIPPQRKNQAANRRPSVLRDPPQQAPPRAYPLSSLGNPEVEPPHPELLYQYAHPNPGMLSYTDPNTMQMTGSNNLTSTQQQFQSGPRGIPPGYFIRPTYAGYSASTYGNPAAPYGAPGSVPFSSGATASGPYQANAAPSGYGNNQYGASAATGSAGAYGNNAYSQSAVGYGNGYTNGDGRRNYDAAYNRTYGYHQYSGPEHMYQEYPGPGWSPVERTGSIDGYPQAGGVSSHHQAMHMQAAATSNNIYGRGANRTAQDVRWDTYGGNYLMQQGTGVNSGSSNGNNNNSINTHQHHRNGAVWQSKNGGRQQHI